MSLFFSAFLQALVIRYIPNSNLNGEKYLQHQELPRYLALFGPSIYDTKVPPRADDCWRKSSLGNLSELFGYSSVNFLHTAQLAVDPQLLSPDDYCLVPPY